MRARRITTVVCAAGLLAVGAACGGETSVVTVTTDEVPGTTTEATTDEATTAEATTDELTVTSDIDLEDRLPAAGALEGTRGGTTMDLDEAEDMTEALYAQGDPARIPAAEQLERSGYAGGVLRDDTGTDPQSGVALFRTYVMELGDAAAAEEETDRSVDEVLATTQLDTDEFDVSSIPGARGVIATGEQGGVNLAVFFVAFPVDRFLYGYQVVARSENGIDTDRVVEIAEEQYAAAM